MNHRTIAFGIATLLSGLALALAGCATTDYISPGQLARLDGFDAQGTPSSGRPVETLDGHPMRVDGDTTLTLDVPGRPAGARFASIRVQDGMFLGKTLDGQEVDVPLSAVRAVKVEQPPDMTAAMIVGGILGGLALGALGVIAWGLNQHGEAATAALR
jgi:hypothetical protein